MSAAAVAEGYGQHRRSESRSQYGQQQRSPQSPEVENPFNGAPLAPLRRLPTKEEQSRGAVNRSEGAMA